MKLKDALIAAAGTILTIVAYFLIAFSRDDWTGPSGTWDPSWVMYLSAAFQFNSIITVTIRSQCTKEVQAEEIGRIFSIVALGQAIVPLFSNPLFGYISKATTDTLPGAYLIVVDVLLFFVLATSIFMFVEEKINQRRSNQMQHQPICQS